MRESCVVYFDQRMGAVHPKRWSKKSFLAFFVVKAEKMQKKVANLVQNLAKSGIISVLEAKCSI